MDGINRKIKNPIKLINTRANQQIENCKTPSKTTPNHHLKYQVSFSSTTLSSHSAQKSDTAMTQSTEKRTLSAKKKLFGTTPTKRKSLFSSSTSTSKIKSSRVSLNDEKLMELFTGTTIDEPLALPFYEHYGNSSEMTLSFSSPSVFSSTKNRFSERPAPPPYQQNIHNAFLTSKSQTPTTINQHINENNNQLQYEKEKFQEYNKMMIKSTLSSTTTSSTTMTTTSAAVVAVAGSITTKNNKTKMITNTTTDENINPTTITTNFITNTLQSQKLSYINNTEVFTKTFNNLEINNQMIKGYKSNNNNNNNNNYYGNEKTTNATMTTTTTTTTTTKTTTPLKSSHSHYTNLLTNNNNNNNNNNNINNVETQDLISRNLLKDRLNRLNKDLNSPSALVKARAIQAMKTVNGQNIYQFDVPHEEQDIITLEEREAPNVRTILDVFRNVIVYVEYRSGNDNRTDGIKSVISDIGIKVNEKLHRNTTHVIFKEGLLSTYNKAKKWNIPMVSLDWLEDCRKRFCLCDVKKYQIADIHRYENPELYKRIRRQKSMQPNISTPTRVNTKMFVAAKATINERDISDSDIEENLNTGENNVESDGSTDNDVFQPQPTNQWNRNTITPVKINSATKNTLLFTPSKEPQLPTITKDVASIVPITKSNNKRRKTMFTPTPGNISPTKSPQKQTPITTKKGSQSSRQTTFELTPIVNKYTDTISSQSTIQTTPYMTTRRRTIIFTPQKQSITQINEISPEAEQSSKMNISSDAINISSSSSSSSSSTLTASTVEFSPNPMFTNVTPKVLTKKYNNKTIHTPTCIDETIMHTHQTFNDIQPPILPLIINTLNVPSTSTPVAEEVNNNAINTPTNISANTPLLSDKTRTNRRRTLFTPNQFMEYSRNEQLKVKSQLVNNNNNNNNNDITMTNAIVEQNIEESIVTIEPESTKTPLISSMNGTPKSTMVDSPYPDINRRQQSTSTLSFCTPTTTANINEKHNTILDEYQNSSTFSSTNVPKSDRRKTMYDISMDIINQRLHNINKIVRKKSLILNRSASESDINNTDDMILDTTLTDQHQMQSKSLLNCSTTTPVIITNAQNVNKRISEQIMDVQKPTIKKRKLFTQSTLEMDENILCEPIIKITPKIKTAVKKTAAAPATSVKKQRIKAIFDDNIKEQRRRSTLDFQDKKYIPSAVSFSSSSFSSTSSSKPSSNSASTTSTNSKLKLLNSRKRQTIVCTSMHQNELNICNETIKQLGDFDMENIVSDRTTHVIALDSRRTINLLRGIMRGLWILDYSWIVRSLQAKKWLYEEPFELQNFSNAISMCRAERQAFGSNYKLEIFRMIDSAIYVSRTCKCPNLKELILLGKGQVTQRKDNAKYIIMDSIKIDKICNYVPATADPKNDNNKTQIYVRSNWILDSITNGHLEPIHKYILNKNNR